MSDIEPRGLKFCIEHASTGMATCQQAACKSAGSKIDKGELRIGTSTLFGRDEEVRWYMAWQHWACTTKHQLGGLKEMANNDATQAPGYDQLSPESQEQVRLAFENNSIVYKTFKDIRPDLAASSSKFGGEIANAYEINALKFCHEQDRSGDLDDAEGYGGTEGLGGLETIPATFKSAVFKTLNDDKLIEIEKNKPEAQPKKLSAKKSKTDEKYDEKPKRGRKKRTAEVMEVDSDSEPEYVPRKTNGARKVEEETINPAVSNIEALAAAMRKNARRG